MPLLSTSPHKQRSPPLSHARRRTTTMGDIPSPSSTSTSATMTTTRNSREFALAAVHSSEANRQHHHHLPLASVARADHHQHHHQHTEPNVEFSSPTFFDFDDMSQYLSYDHFLDASSSSNAPSLAVSTSSPFAVSPPSWLDSASEPSLSPIHVHAMNRFHHARTEGSAGADSLSDYPERKDSTDTVTDSRPGSGSPYFAARPVQTGLPSPPAQSALQPQSQSGMFSPPNVFVHCQAPA